MQCIHIHFQVILRLRLPKDPEDSLYIGTLLESRIYLQGGVDKHGRLLLSFNLRKLRYERHLTGYWRRGE